MIITGKAGNSWKTLVKYTNLDNQYNYNIGNSNLAYNPITNPTNNINYNKYFKLYYQYLGMSNNCDNTNTKPSSYNNINADPNSINESEKNQYQMKQSNSVKNIYSAQNPNSYNANNYYNTNTYQQHNQPPQDYSSFNINYNVDNNLVHYNNVLRNEYQNSSNSSNYNPYNSQSNSTRNSPHDRLRMAGNNIVN
jgi:hypothetical protein